MSRLTDAVSAAVKASFAPVSYLGPVSNDPASGYPLRGIEAGDTSLIFGAGVAGQIVDAMSAGDLYATQPHLRTVTSFLGRNVAQLGRHVFTRKADGSRERVRTSAAAELLRRPNSYMTGYDLINMLVVELALHDFHLWVPVLRGGRWEVDPIPGEWITGIKGADAFRQAGYKIQVGGNGQPQFLPADQVIVFRGYSPNGFAKGTSPVKSLKATLQEQLSALEFRQQMWSRGGRIGTYLTRPQPAAGQAGWSTEARDRFITAWRNNWSGSGGNAGSTPLLEDGMELKSVRFNAKEEQWLEAATLSLTTVAGAYHVPPVMVGANTGATLSSTREYRKMLYIDTLGPTIAQVEDVINTFLLPFIGEPDGNYVELNIAEKLQGDFVEQGAILQSAAGAPYMTRNEVRALQNLPALDGGDELVVPLNVLVGGQASPTDSGSQNDQGLDSEGGTSGASSGPLPTRKSSTAQPRLNRKAPATVDPDPLVSELRAFFKRQQRDVLSKLDGDDWWNQKAWNKELSGLLLPLLTSLSAGAARELAGAKDLDPDDYSVGRTTAFLKAVSESRADLINATTRDELIAVLEDAEDRAEAVTTKFEVIRESRAPQVGKTIGTFLGAWVATEVAEQLLADKEPTKTWVVQSANPRSDHAAMDGETVKVSEPFSNGAMYPGDPVLGAEGVANCACGVDINY